VIVDLTCRCLLTYLAVIVFGGPPAVQAGPRLDDWRRGADSLSTQAEVLYNSGKYEAARDMFQRHIELVRDHCGNNHPDIVESMIWVAATQWKMGHHAAGERVARDAIDLARRVYGADHPQVGEGLNVLGLCLMAQGKFAEAEAAYRSSMALLESHFGRESEEVAMCLNNLGALAGEQTRWDRAEAFYRSAHAIHLKLLGEDNLSVARTMHNIGFAAAARNDVLTARHYLEHALEVRRRHLGDDHPDVLLTLQTLARTYRRDNPDHEFELLEQVLLARRRLLGDAHPHVAWALRDLAHASMARGDYGRAEALLEEALAIYGHADEPMEYARTLFAMAAAKVNLGKFDETELYLDRACAVGLTDRDNSMTLRMLGGIRCLEGRYSDAERILLESAKSFERARVDYSGPQSRMLGTVAAPYPLLAATYMWQGRPEMAWAALERSLARGLIDRLAVDHADEAAPTTTLNKVQQSLGAQDAIIGWLDIDIFGKSPAAWAYVIRDRGPVHFAALESAPDLENGETIGEHPIRFRESLRYAAAWVTRVTDVQRIEQDAHALWRERIAPVDIYLQGVTHLIVCGSDAMDGIPVAALMDDKGMTTDERFVVSHTPSATIHVWMGQRPRRRDHEIERALLVGDPPLHPQRLAQSTVMAAAVTLDGAALRSALAGNRDALASLPALPQSRFEINGIAATLSHPEILVGPDASEDTIADLVSSGELAACDAVHFATHALIDPLFPGISALVLSQVDPPNPVTADISSNPTDGLLTVDEIFDAWKLDAEVVTLSGCQTALGRKIRGEGYFGFAQAFFAAGARSVVLSLWEVDDTATALLMTRFYQNLTGSYKDVREGRRAMPIPKAAALREAKQWLRHYESNGVHPFAHPAYWAAFVLIGDAN